MRLYFSKDAMHILKKLRLFIKLTWKAQFVETTITIIKKQIRTLREMRKSSDLFVLVTHPGIEPEFPA